MIITKNIVINITNSNIKNYQHILNIKIGKNEIPVEYLSKGSHIKINVKCDICNKEKYIPYRQYISSINNGNYYCCSSDCAKNKNKNTNKEKYGVESVTQLDIVKEKIKNTCLKKYGVDSYLKTKEKQEKSKETCINKYGFESSNKSEIVKNNKKISFFEKYGVENPSQSEIIKEKKKNTLLMNYGVENPMYDHNIKEKKNKSNIIKYGVENPMQNNIVIEKMKQTNIKLYKCENVFENDEIKQKIKHTCLEKYGTEHYMQSSIHKQIFIDNYLIKYGILPDERKLQFKYYRSKVSYATDKNKEELLKNWNGIDFYDGEYIKDNFNLHIMNKNYPTIDHKISVYYGFNNNIPPEEISKLDNLCFTKKGLNSSKNKKCDYERKEKN